MKFRVSGPGFWAAGRRIQGTGSAALPRSYSRLNSTYLQGSRFKGLRFMVQGSGFKVQGLGSRV